MKANLKFNLIEPEDDQELRRCLKALDLAIAISDMADLLRGARKNDKEEVIKSEDFYDILHARGIIIDDLIS